MSFANNILKQGFVAIGVLLLFVGDGLILQPKLARNLLCGPG